MRRSSLCVLLCRIAGRGMPVRVLLFSSKSLLDFKSSLSKLTQQPPVSALGYYGEGRMLVKSNEEEKWREDKPYCSYPNASISLWHVSAYCLISNPASPGQLSVCLSKGGTHLLHTTTETIIRQTRNNNIKRRAPFPFPFLQQRQNPAALKEIPRPAMHEQQRDCVLTRGFLVQEVDVQFSKALNLNFCHELRQLVHLLFLLPPVIFRAPVFRETFYISSEGNGVSLGEGRR